MNFDLDQDQREFAVAAKEFFAGQPTLETVRVQLDDPGDPMPGHKRLAELGFTGFLVPESLGGIDRTVLDLAVVAEQAGRALAAPSLATVARVSVLLADHPDELAALAAGEKTYAAVDGPLDGSDPVLDARQATEFLALDGDDLVVGDARVLPGEPMDPSRGLARVHITPRRVLSRNAAQEWAHARDVAAAILAAEGLGTAERAVEIAVEYARERQAFGRAVGSFQAIKHRLVDAWAGVDQLRSLVWWAAWAADSAPGQLPLAASAAKAYAARALETAAETLVHVHGGMGFTWEHDAHLFWRRAKVDRLLLGSESTHLDRVAGLALAELSHEQARDGNGERGNGS